MNWNNIQLVFMREVRDQLRDRRTLMMVAVLPLLLYPALGFLMMQILLSVTQQEQSVLVVNPQALPQTSLVEYLAPVENASGMSVFTDDKSSWSEKLDETRRKQLTDLIDNVETHRQQIDRLNSLLALEQPTADEKQQSQELRNQIDQWFEEAKTEVVVIVPDGFAEAYDAYTDAIAAGESTEDLETPQPVILNSSANDNSVMAAGKVKDALRKWETELLKQRLVDVNFPENFIDPVSADFIDVAEPDKIAANIWSKILPALLVLFSVTGALYPAIDLGAGEKERGTMETLLISPATRTEIVLGKFFTVMLFSYSTAVLNLVSMGFTFQNTLSVIGNVKDSPMGALAFPPLSSAAWVILFALPIAALFSALSLSLAMFARSSKEGQYYLTPLLMIAMGLTMFCMFPVDIVAYHSVIPVVGPSLVLKALLLEGILSKTVLTFGIPALASSIGYSFLALWWAIDLFQREDILFRESERFEIRQWFKHLLREKEETPSFIEAGVCFALIIIVQQIFMKSMQRMEILTDPVAMTKSQAIFLVATVGVPAVMMAMLLTTNIWKTLKLQLPDWKYLAAAVVLAFTLHPVMLTVLENIKWCFPPPPPGASEIMKGMTADAVPLWLALTAFAIAPAVCEELAFRGFILTALQDSRHRWLPIFISALLFGVIHMIPQQMFNAALLGIVIGLIAVRSRSLIPGVIFHFIFNGTQVLTSRVPPNEWNSGVTKVLFTMDDATGEPGAFSVPLLVVCTIISAILIAWLVKGWSDEISAENAEKQRLIDEHSHPSNTAMYTA